MENDKLVDWVYNAHDQTYERGGYKPVVVCIDDLIIVVPHERYEPSIHVFRRSVIRDAYAEAIQEMRDGAFEDMREAFWELVGADYDLAGAPPLC